MAHMAQQVLHGGQPMHGGAQQTMPMGQASQPVQQSPQVVRMEDERPEHAEETKSRGRKGPQICGIVFGQLGNLLQILTCIAMLVILHYKLRHARNHACLLDGFRGTYKVSLCNYAYALPAFGLLGGLLIAAIMIMTSCCAKIAGTLATLLSLVGSLWWIVGAIILTVFGVKALRNDFPWPGWIIAEIVLSWIAVLLFSSNVVLSICACLTGRR